MSYKNLLILLFIFGSISISAQRSQLLIAEVNTQQKSLLIKQNFEPAINSISLEEFNKALRYKPKKHPLEKTGRILTFIGVPLVVIGGIMVAGADELYYECYNGYCEGDPRGGFGVIILAAGLGMSGAGIVLWTIGLNKR